MADMMELDSILENDLIDALEDLGSQDISSSSKEDVQIAVKQEPQIKSELFEDPSKDLNDNLQNNISLETNGSDLSCITKLLQELLSNKTLEITIKVKN